MSYNTYNSGVASNKLMEIFNLINAHPGTKVGSAPIQSANFNGHVQLDESVTENPVFLSGQMTFVIAGSMQRYASGADEEQTTKLNEETSVKVKEIVAAITAAKGAELKITDKDGKYAVAIGKCSVGVVDSNTSYGQVTVDITGYITEATGSAGSSNYLTLGTPDEA